MLFSRHWLGMFRLVVFLAGQQGPGNPCIFVRHGDIGDVFSTPLLDVTNPAIPFVRVLVRHSNTPVIPHMSNRITPRDLQLRRAFVPKTDRIPPCRHPIRTAGGQLYDYAELSQPIDLAFIRTAPRKNNLMGIFSLLWNFK